jgi:hypothetical protein
MRSRNEDIPDCIFPSKNGLEIPDLSLEWQANYATLPFWPWGKVNRRAKEQAATWHYFIKDAKFSFIWANPRVIYDTGCINICEVNFSLNDDMPRSVGIWRTYQKRFISAYLGGIGVKIFVDLNVPSKFSKLNLIGVPHGWRAYCTRGYNGKTDEDLIADYNLAKKRAYHPEVNPNSDMVFILYGGGAHSKTIAREFGWVYIQEEAHKQDKQVRNDG